MLHRILAGTLDDRSIMGAGGTLLQRLQEAGYKSTDGGSNLGLCGWDRHTNLIQPGADATHSATFHVTDTTPHTIRYHDAAKVLKDLRVSKKSVNNGKWHAWCDSWKTITETANRPDLRHRIPDYAEHGKEIDACQTDEEIDALAEQVLNRGAYA